MNKNCLHYEGDNGDHFILNLNNVTVIEYNALNNVTTLNFMGNHIHKCNGKFIFNSIKDHFFKKETEYTRGENG